MAPEPSTRRKYVRIRAPEGMLVGWKSVGQTSTSRAGNMGLGGLYLHAAHPPSEGSSIEVILDLPTGQVRARAIVRRVTLGKGMGVQFVQMKPEDRAKLNQYLSQQELSQKALAVAPAANSRPASSQLVISPRREEAAQLRFQQELSHLIELTGRVPTISFLESHPNLRTAKSRKAITCWPANSIRTIIRVTAS